MTAESTDVLILGTGLTESILAGALSRVGFRVVHADHQSTYGDSWSTLTLPELQSWIKGTENPSNSFRILTVRQESSLSPAVENIARHFNLDLVPKLIYAKSDFVESLIDTRLGNYLEFKLMKRSYLYHDGKFLMVPMSKEDVFINKDVTMIEKRKLMKFINGVLDWIQAPEDAKEFLGSADYLQQTFACLLKEHGLTGRLADLVAYSIALLNEPNLETISATSGLQAMSKYVQSLGRYGASPFLIPLFGTSELVQAFCRLSAVFGGIYLLDQKKMVLDYDGDTVNSVSFPTKGESLKFIPKYTIMSRHYVPSNKDAAVTRIKRCIVIINEPISDIFKTITHDDDCDEDEEDACMLTFPPHSINNSHPVHGLLCGSGLKRCPEGFCCLHLWSLGNEESLQRAASALLGEPDAEKQLLHMVYEQTMNDSVLDFHKCIIKDPNAEICLDDLLYEAKSTFDHITRHVPREPPGEDEDPLPELKFLLKVPDPETHIDVTKAETTASTSAIEQAN